MFICLGSHFEGYHVPYILSPKTWHESFSMRLKGSISITESSAEMIQLDKIDFRKTWAVNVCTNFRTLSECNFSAPAPASRSSLVVPSSEGPLHLLPARRSAPEWCHWEFQAEAHFLLIKRHFFNSIHVVSLLHMVAQLLLYDPAPSLPSFLLLSLF